MPLKDHFHPPLSEVRHWESFHARWATGIADLLEGDFRLLYLAWLKAMTMYGDPYADEGYDNDDTDVAAYDREPPVPPGLKKLSPPLQNFVQVFEIDPFLAVGVDQLKFQTRLFRFLTQILLKQKKNLVVIK